MKVIPRLCLSLVVMGPRLLLATEPSWDAWLEEEAGGFLYLHTTTEVGRVYQVEWSPSLEPAHWAPALAHPAEGTDGQQAFFLGQRPDVPGTPPVHPSRRDFTMAAGADGTSLAQWQSPDGTIVKRRVALDFRQVPRLAVAVTETATVVTRTQLAPEVSSVDVPVSPDPDPEIRAALEALAEAYPLLKFSPPDFLVRGSAESGALAGTKFWRIRRLEQDVDGDTLTDFHEWHTSQTNPLAADSDGDGASDGAELTAGSAPLDFFNGTRPRLVRLPSRWGDIPFSGPNEWLSEPLEVEVLTPDGAPLPNAPITFAASAGGLDLWSLPATRRSPRPVLTTRTDSAGRVEVAWRSDGAVNTATLVHAWVGQGLSYQGSHHLVHTMRALPPLEPTVLAWLKSSAEVGLGADGRVESWSDEARSITATAAGALRPLLNVAGPLPLIEFDGSHRLDLSSAQGGSTMSAFFVAQPTALRTQAPVNAADPANRAPGLTGQKYVLAGQGPVSASPWLHIPPVPRILQTTQYFSRYAAEYFTVDPIYDIRGYNCRDITYTFGQLLPSLPVTQIPSVRYDVTFGAVPDPGPPRRQRGATYRLNPLLPNCPLKPGASLSAVLTDFIARRGLPSTYQWETRVLDNYTRRAGNPVVNDFSEIYYEAKGYSPGVPEQWVLQPSSIGIVGQGISLGTNSAGYFHLAQGYAPSLGSRPSPPVPPPLHLTSLVVINGRPTFFTNGTVAGGSVSPMGGIATGLRHIGSLAGGTNGFVGTVGDIVLTAGAPGEEARQSLEDTLADRHRLVQVDRDQDTLPDWWERRSLAAGPAATPTADPDADGLVNVQERTRFTLPELADSDRDGLDDAVESAAAAVMPDTDGDGFLDGTDVTVTDPGNGRSDANGDGVPDGLASLLAAPDQRDSDGDSLSDLVESITTRTNPLAADTDGDTLPDSWEVANGLDPNNPSGDHGALGDPDGDGSTNAQERALGTDPLVAG